MINILSIYYINIFLIIIMINICNITGDFYLHGGIYGIDYSKLLQPRYDTCLTKANTPQQ